MVKRALKVFRKLASSSPEELRVRGVQLLHARQERWGLSGDTHEPTDAQFATMLADPYSGMNAESLRSHLATRNAPQFFAGVRSRAAADALNTPAWERARHTLLESAERVLEGRFDLLGY